MALTNNAVCDICGKSYHVCATCKDVLSFKPWRTITDTPQHYKIFLAISDYTRTKDKVKAKADLKNCDLSELETFNNDIKNVIREILEEQEKTKISSKKRNTEIENKKNENSE